MCCSNGCAARGLAQCTRVQAERQGLQIQRTQQQGVQKQGCGWAAYVRRHVCLAAVRSCVRNPACQWKPPNNPARCAKNTMQQPPSRLAPRTLPRPGMWHYSSLLQLTNTQEAEISTHLLHHTRVHEHVECHREQGAANAPAATLLATTTTTCTHRDREPQLRRHAANTTTGKLGSNAVPHRPAPPSKPL